MCYSLCVGPTCNKAYNPPSGVSQATGSPVTVDASPEYFVVLPKVVVVVASTGVRGYPITLSTATTPTAPTLGGAGAPLTSLTTPKGIARLPGSDTDVLIVEAGANRVVRASVSATGAVTLVGTVISGLNTVLSTGLAANPGYRIAASPNLVCVTLAGSSETVNGQIACYNGPASPKYVCLWMFVCPATASGRCDAVLPGV